MKRIVTTTLLSINDKDVPAGTALARIELAEGIPLDTVIGVLMGGRGMCDDDDDSPLPDLSRAKPANKTPNIESNTESNSNAAFPGLEPYLQEALAKEGIDSIEILREIVDSGTSLASLDAIKAADAKLILKWLKSQPQT